MDESLHLVSAWSAAMPWSPARILPRRRRPQRPGGMPDWHEEEAPGEAGPGQGNMDFALREEQRPQ